MVQDNFSGLKNVPHITTKNKLIKTRKYTNTNQQTNQFTILVKQNIHITNPTTFTTEEHTK